MTYMIEGYARAKMEERRLRSRPTVADRVVLRPTVRSMVGRTLIALGTQLAGEPVRRRAA